MTLAALLEELKVVDAEQSEKLQCWISRTRQFMNLEVPLECDLAQALIQNSIQRACKRREWIWHYGHGPEMGYVATVNHVNIVKGDSATEVLLAAYIAAVREKAKK